MLKTFRESLCAGILIAIGGSVFLACDNKYMGAIFFSVALLCICYKAYVLYTGKVGFIVNQHSKTDVSNLFTGLIGNLITTFLLGMLIRYILPDLGTRANEICMAKLNQSAFATLVRGFFCGVLMYLAVSIYKEKKTALAILFCVPVFILSGFEHSIADMFYFGASGIYSSKIILFMIMVILGNSIGGMILPLLTFTGEKGNEGQ